MKEIEGKLYYEIDWDFIKSMAERMAMNKDKYPRWNWTNMSNEDREGLLQALTRHFIEVSTGNWSDEQVNGHLIAIACNCMMLNRNNENKPDSDLYTITNTLDPKYNTFGSTDYKI